uniref:HTH_Tnp_Tc3_1 domain-containing protein n=1 Tax=Haemonchus placei TaxID=6290 RepID=A0A0N4X954_HAEPC
LLWHSSRSLPICRHTVPSQRDQGESCGLARKYWSKLEQTKRIDIPSQMLLLRSTSRTTVSRLLNAHRRSTSRNSMRRKKKTTMMKVATL